MMDDGAGRSTTAPSSSRASDSSGVYEEVALACYPSPWCKTFDILCAATQTTNHNLACVQAPLQKFQVPGPGFVCK